MDPPVPFDRSLPGVFHDHNHLRCWINMDQLFAPRSSLEIPVEIGVYALAS